MSLARVYCKTEAGLDEVHRRQAGLNPRVRQLLILVDGKRSVPELARMMAVTEFEEFLALLELKGLISPLHMAATVAEGEPHVLPQEGLSALNVPGAVRLEGSLDHYGHRESEVALAPAVNKTTMLVSPRTSEALQLERDRSNMSKLLQETVGPLAEDLCLRIGRASRRAELSELFVASLTVVELMSGRKAAERFVEKMKVMGWEV
jgi:hypothetical protein